MYDAVVMETQNSKRASPTNSSLLVTQAKSSATTQKLHTARNPAGCEQQEQMKRWRKGRTALCELMAAGVLKPGCKVISVRGRTGHVSADLTAEGSIMYNRTEFLSPSRFAMTVLQWVNCPGWYHTVYKVSCHPEEWRTLDSLRSTCVRACVL